MSSRRKDIADFMNIFSKDKVFTAFDVGLMESGYQRYQKEYRKAGIKAGRKRKDLEENNKNLADYLGGMYTPEQIKLFKRSMYLMSIGGAG
jgi:hypothetical protein